MKGLKLKGWKPNKRKPKECYDYIRRFVVQIVYARYRQNSAASTVSEVHNYVEKHVRQRLDKDKDWPLSWGWIGRPTTKRRLEEACEPTWYEDGVPRLASSTAGYFQPNPIRYQRVGE